MPAANSLDMQHLMLSTHETPILHIDTSLGVLAGSTSILRTLSMASSFSVRDSLACEPSALPNRVVSLTALRSLHAERKQQGFQSALIDPPLCTRLSLLAEWSVAGFHMTGLRIPVVTSVRTLQVTTASPLADHTLWPQWRGYTRDEPQNTDISASACRRFACPMLANKM